MPDKIERQVRHPVDTPDGVGGVLEVRDARVRVVFPNGTIREYDVNDCLFAGEEDLRRLA